MQNKSSFIVLVFSVWILHSCYHKELQYSFTTSYGGVLSGSSEYYLAELKEFQNPKGISKFPDGGRSKMTKQLFGLYKTDTLANSTILVAKLGNVSGWPSRYSTRMEKNQEYIAIGIINVTTIDSVSGIYLYDLKKNTLQKYSSSSALPSISKYTSQLVYCIENRLIIEDYQTKTTLRSYLLNESPAFVNWKNENEIFLFYSKPFTVDILSLETGKIYKTDLDYITNYDQELNTTQLSKNIQFTQESLKEITKNY